MSKKITPTDCFMLIMNELAGKNINTPAALEVIEKLKGLNETAILANPIKLATPQIVHYEQLIYLIEAAACHQDTTVLRALIDLKTPLQNAIWYALRHDNPEAIILLKGHGATLPKSTDINNVIQHAKFTLGKIDFKMSPDNNAKIQKTLKEVNQVCGVLDDAIINLRQAPDSAILPSVIQANNEFKDKYGVDYLRTNVKSSKATQKINLADCQSIIEQIQAAENDFKLPNPNELYHYETTTNEEHNVDTMGDKEETQDI